MSSNTRIIKISKGCLTESPFPLQFLFIFPSSPDALCPENERYRGSVIERLRRAFKYQLLPPSSVSGFVSPFLLTTTWQWGEIALKATDSQPRAELESSTPSCVIEEVSRDRTWGHEVLPRVQVVSICLNGNTSEINKSLLAYLCETFSLHCVVVLLVPVYLLFVSFLIGQLPNSQNKMRSNHNINTLLWVQQLLVENPRLDYHEPWWCVHCLLLKSMLKCAMVRVLLDRVFSQQFYDITLDE